MSYFNIKEALKVLLKNNEKFFYDETILNKLFTVRLTAGQYNYIMYRNSIYEISLGIKCDNETITFRFSDNCTEIMVRSYDSAVQAIIPDENASEDEWFNFNIQYSLLTKDDIYPEINGLYEILTDDYNRVFMTVLERRGMM